MILFIEQLASTLCISFEFNLTTILYYSSLIRLLLLILHFVYSILIYKFFRLAESIKCFFQTGMKRTMNQSNYYSAEKISNKESFHKVYVSSRFTAYQSYHSSFREHSSRPIFTGIFNREKDSQKGRERIPRRTAIDVKMINDARLINIILNSMPLEIAPHTLLSFKNNVKAIFWGREDEIINFFLPLKTNYNRCHS